MISEASSVASSFNVELSCGHDKRGVTGYSVSYFELKSAEGVMPSALVFCSVVSIYEYRQNYTCTN